MHFFFEVNVEQYGGKGGGGKGGGGEGGGGEGGGGEGSGEGGGKVGVPGDGGDRKSPQQATASAHEHQPGCAIQSEAQSQ